MTIKILHLITSLESGGAQTMMGNLVRGMDPQHFDSTVVTLIDPDESGRRFVGDSAALYSLGMRRGRPDPRALGRLMTHLRELRPDIVQTWLYHADLMGLIAQRLARVGKLAWNIRGTPPAGLGFSAQLPNLLAQFSDQPDVVVVNSRAGLKDHRALGFRPRQWRVIANGFDLQRFRPDPDRRAQMRAEIGVPQQATLIGMAARVHPMKDHESFLRATLALNQTDPDLHYVLIGRDTKAESGPMRDLLAQVPTRAHLHHLGERHDMDRVLPALDFLALPSAYGEGFPNVLAEAMACGVPCVSTRVGDSALVIGDVGLTVPRQDPAALAGALRRLVRLSPDERAALSTRARQRIADNFELSGIIWQYEDLYRGLAAGEALPLRA